MHNYKKLNVWADSIVLVEMIYKCTEDFPEKEKFGLISQMRRSAVSIASNIAEGAGRNSDKDFLNFLGMSLGSAFELGTQLVVSNRLSFLNTDQLGTIETQLEMVQKQIYKLQENLRNRNSQ